MIQVFIPSCSFSFGDPNKIRLSLMILTDNRSSQRNGKVALGL